jgi:hypothetical protein
VTLPVEGLFPFPSFASPAPASRWVVLFSMPALALVLWAGFRLALTSGGKQVARWMFPRAPEHVASPEHIGRFGSSYDTIVLGVVLLVLGLHAGALAAALGANGVAVRIAPAVLGASLLLMGNVMPRLRPNWIAGIRTRRTLADPELWRSTHRAFGAAFVVAGLVTVVAGIAVPRVGMVVGLGGIVAALLVGFVASRRGSGTTTAVLAAVALVCTTADGIGAQNQPSRPVELVTPAEVVETAYSFTRDGLTIHGTLATPRGAVGKIPVVVIVAGSGLGTRTCHWRRRSCRRSRDGSTAVHQRSNRRGGSFHLSALSGPWSDHSRVSR